MSKLLLIISSLLVTNALVWFQVNGQFIYNWAKSPWIVGLLGIPTSLMFWTMVRWSYEYFDDYWTIRILGFGVGAISFGILTWLLLGETPTVKTIISLILALCIVLLQVKG